MLRSPQTILDDEKSVTANVSVDFSTDISTLSHNDPSDAASKLASKEESEDFPGTFMQGNFQLSSRFPKFYSEINKERTRKLLRVII